MRENSSRVLRVPLNMCSLPGRFHRYPCRFPRPGALRCAFVKHPGGYLHKCGRLHFFGSSRNALHLTDSFFRRSNAYDGLLLQLSFRPLLFNSTCTLSNLFIDASIIRLLMGSRVVLELRYTSSRLLHTSNILDLDIRDICV
jgi:hypothetical protein